MASAFVETTAYSSLDRANIREYLELTDTMYQLPSFRQLITKASEQHEITSLGLDVAAFSEAIKAFQYLQHVQLFRVQADLDERFITHFRRNVIVGGGLVSYEWMASTLYASTTLARAMIGSGAMLRADTPLSRISCQLDPESATLLIQRSESATVLIAEHLECLSLRFELSNSPGEIEMLGVTLRDLLRVSKNMVSLHIGFPQQPVALSLHSIFQCVQLDKIRVLSLDGWRLSGQQIVAITRQYKQTLRGLRLRGVLLDVEPIEHNEEDGNGFIWRDVLVFLRNETQLQWISLRRINYAQYWDSIMAGARDVTDDGDDQSESEVEGTWDQDTTQDNADETIQEESEDDISEYEDDHSSDLNSEGGDNSIADSNLDSDHDIVPPARRARRQIGYPWDQQCSCSGDPESLHDDGEFVEKAQWKFWEKWVLGRSYCALHGQKVARP